MGTGKKEKTRLRKEGKEADGTKVKGENFYRSRNKVKTLSMYKEGKAIRNKDGNIIKAAAFQSRDVPKARIEPDRRWFNNTRVISQGTLQAFREAVAEQQKNPYSVLLKTNKLPMSLIRDNKDALPEDGVRKHKARITVETEPFALTFGPKSQRKRVKLSHPDINALAGDTDASLDKYQSRQEEIRLLNGQAGAAAEDGDAPLDAAVEPIFSKGTSRRIFNELYKVIDSSDVVLMVLDARDPLGTRCRSVEKYLRTEAAHKHVVFVLNKIDLVPTKVAASWVKALQKERPTCAMRSSMKNPFGRGSLIDLLRQFSILHKDKKQISVGLIGYPNVGKSSIINCLRGKMVAKVAPIPGETKVWQYVALMKRIHMIDCPGIVPPNRLDTPEALLLRGTVRVENVANPEQYMPAVLQRVKPHHLERTYDLRGWSDHHEFLDMLARKGGRLLRGGEPDVDGVAKMVLNDFMRGKIPWFVPPPDAEDGGVDDAVKEGREGRLGEMPKKRKRDDESMLDTSIGETSTVAAAEESASQPKVNESFEGFDESDSQPDMEEQKDLQHTTIAKPAEESLNGDNEDEIALEDTSEDDSQGDMVEEDSEDDDDKDEGDDSDDSIDLDLQGLADEILNSSDDGDSGHADVPAPTRKST